MNTRNLTREAIEELNDIEPYCFETDREEQWFNIGLQYGLDVADSDPISPWISVKDDLPCNHEELLDPSCEYNETVIVLTVCGNGYYLNWMKLKRHGEWEWHSVNNVTHWMKLPELPKEEEIK